MPERREIEEERIRAKSGERDRPVLQRGDRPTHAASEDNALRETPSVRTGVPRHGV